MDDVDDDEDGVRQFGWVVKKYKIIKIKYSVRQIG